MKTYIFLFLMLIISSCNSSEEKEVDSTMKHTIEIAKVPILNLVEANKLAQLPLNCMDIEYPNKLNQTIGGDFDLASPKTLHPTFYGCFDWHSAVHGHWSLVSLLRQFPDLENSDIIKAKLLQSISEVNIKIEVEYFNGTHNKSYERTYGWAWVLKLAEELKRWDNPTARELENNLKPLTDLMIEKYLDFLPKLNYPIRSGEHPNTAFGLSFAYDYATTVNHQELKLMIEKRAREFYLEDENCPMNWEPSGFDFLSPCLEEAALMKRVLSKADFMPWLEDFMPELLNKDFYLEPGRVSDRTDGKLVHLDGVNFSRAWCLNIIALNIPELSHLQNNANTHINYSLPSIVDDNYEGGHWLGSFAIFALNSITND